MIANAQQIQRGIMNYLDIEIAQKSVGVRKFAVYFLMPQLSNNIERFISSLGGNVLAKDMFDENGNIELDTVYGQAKDAMRKCVQIEYAGIIFTENDVDMLYNYITRG